MLSSCFLLIPLKSNSCTVIAGDEVRYISFKGWWGQIQIESNIVKLDQKCGLTQIVRHLHQNAIHVIYSLLGQINPNFVIMMPYRSKTNCNATAPFPT